SHVDCPCLKDITQPTGTITSPGPPSGSDGQRNCAWLVHAEHGFIIELTFEPPFQVGSTGRLVTGAAVRTPYLEVLQKLGWDRLATRRDYHRLVTMYKLWQPPPAFGCLAPTRPLIITATGTERVEIYDGASDTAPSLGTFSGGQPPHRMYSTGSDVYIRFVSLGSTTGLAGFTAKFRWVGLPVGNDDLMAGPSQGVGLSNRWIPDSYVTASSALPGNEAAQARLHNMMSPSETGGWRPTNDTIGSEWVKVTFPTKRAIVGISTQGIRGPTNCWVTSYHVGYAYQGAVLHAVRRTFLRRKNDPDFRGNFDADTVVTNMFNRPIATDSVYIFPQAVVNHICLRFELLEPAPDPSASMNVAELSNGGSCRTGDGLDCPNIIDGVLYPVPGLWSPSGTSDSIRVELGELYVIHRIRVMQGNDPAVRIRKLKFFFSENGLSSPNQPVMTLQQRSQSDAAAMLWDDVKFPPDYTKFPPHRARFISLQVTEMYTGQITQASISEIEIYTMPQEHETLCSPGWISRGFSCYFISYEEASEDADQLCSGLRPLPGVVPHLAELTSDEERSFLSGYAAKIMEKSTVGANLEIVQVRDGCLQITDSTIAPCSVPRPYICEFNYKYDTLPRSCREALDRARILGEYPRKGIYHIRVKSRVLSVYCDMTRDGGGWTLLVTASTREGWEGHVTERHVGYPSVNRDYSVLGYGNMIKDSFPGDKFHYRIEVGPNRYWGGVWEAPKSYSLVHGSPHQTDINILRRYGPWTHGEGSLGHRLPWVPNAPASPALLTTSSLADGNVPWGTLIARAPRTQDKNVKNMIADRLSGQDLSVRYWIREQADIDELDCKPHYHRWNNGEVCYKKIGTRGAYGAKCDSYALITSKQQQDTIASILHGKFPYKSYWIANDNSTGAWLPGFPQSPSTENTCTYLDHTKGYGWATTDCGTDQKSSLCEEGCIKITPTATTSRWIVTVAVTQSSTFTFYVKPTNGTIAWKLHLWADDFYDRYRIFYGRDGKIQLSRMTGYEINVRGPRISVNIEEESFQKFWVRLADGKLAIGRGGELQPLDEWAESLSVRGPPWYIGVRDHVNGIKSEWKFCDLAPGFCTGDECRRGYREDCTDGINHFTCPSEEPDSTASPSCLGSPETLGLENQRLPDDQIQASTSQDTALNARLNSKRVGWLIRSLDWVIDASASFSGNGPENVLDNIPSTYWNPQTPGPYFIVFDFKTLHSLSKIGITNWPDTTHDVREFKFQRSVNYYDHDAATVNWEDVVTVTTVQAGISAQQEFGGFSATARFWKLLITHTHATFQPYIREVNFFGAKGAIPDTRPGPRRIIFPAPQSVDNYAQMVPTLDRDLTSFTLCLHIRTGISPSDSMGLVSYATANQHNELLLYSRSNAFQLYVNGQRVDIADLPIYDNVWHEICATWSSTAGHYQLYADGVLRASDVGLSVGEIVNRGGAWILGQDQDTLGGGFVQGQAFRGELSQVNLWDRVLSEAEIGTSWSAFCSHHGNVIDWRATNVQFFGQVRSEQYMRCADLIDQLTTNVALGKMSTQSSMYNEGLANLATDGNTNPDYNQRSCTHTDGQYVDPWWRVDLEVVVFNRAAVPGRINPFQLHIGDSTVVRSNPKCGGEHRFPESWPPSLEISCNGMRGRYVGIQLLGPDRVLTLCEVQVFTDTAIGGGWVPPISDLQAGDDIWIGVTLTSPELIIGILTQGADDQHYVSSYKMSYSIDGNVFKSYEENCEDKIFYGNTDGDTIAKNILEKPVTALAVGIHPVAWRRSHGPGLRFDFLTCHGQVTDGPMLDVIVDDVTTNSISLQLPVNDDGTVTSHSQLTYTEEASGKTASATFSENPGVVTDLLPGMKYRLKLTVPYGALERFGVGRATTELPLPEILSVSAGETSVHLTWTPILTMLNLPAETNLPIWYNVICVSSDDTQSKVNSSQTLHSSGTNITGLTPGKTYNIVINLFSPYIEGDTATQTVTTERDAITDLEVVEVTETLLSFKWSPPLAPHLAFMASLSAPDGSELPPVFSYGHSAEFRGLTPATLYTVAVTVLRSDGGDPDPVVTLRVSTAIDSPTSFVVSMATTTSLTVTWNQPYARFTWYNITYCACALGFHGNADSATAVSLPADREEYTIQGLLPSTAYNISLVAWTQYEASDRVLTRGHTDTESPSELTVSQVTASSISLTWEPPGHLPDYYVIRYANAFSGMSDAVTIEVERSASSVVLQGLSPGTEYTVGISAATALGESEVVYLNAITATDAPTDVVITRSDVDPTTADLTWTAPVAVITGYTVTFSVSRSRSSRSVSEEETHSVSVDRTATDVTLHDLLPLQYTVTIRAEGVHADSEEVEVILEEYIAPTINDTTDLDGETENDSFFDIGGSESVDSEAVGEDGAGPTDAGGTRDEEELWGDSGRGTEMPEPDQDDLVPSKLKPIIDALKGTGMDNATAQVVVAVDNKKFQEIINGFIKALLEPMDLDELGAALRIFVNLHERFPHLFKEFQDDVIYIGNRLLQGLESLGARETDSGQLNTLLNGLFDILGPFITMGFSESPHLEGHSIERDLQANFGDLLGSSGEDPWLDDAERKEFVDSVENKKQEDKARVFGVLTTIDRAANLALRAVQPDGRSIELRGPGEEVLKGVAQQVNVKAKSFQANPFTWDTSVRHTSSPVLELTLLNDDFKTVHYHSNDNYVTITLPRLTNHVSAPKQHVIAATRRRNKAAHAFNLTSPGYGLLLRFDFKPANVICRIDLAYGEEPEVSKWDRIQDVIQDVGFKLDSSTNDSKVLLVNGTQIVKGNETVLVPELSDIGSYHFSLRFYGFETNFYHTEYGTGYPMRIEYSILVTTIGCRFRNETTDQWEGGGCKVSPKSTLTETVCLCNHLTMFATDAFVPPNSINFDTVFSKPIHSSGIVLSTVIFLWLILFVAMMYARLADIKDRKKWVTSSLPDDNPHDQYKYEITVYTGTARKAGTRSRIAFLLCGQDADTGVRIFDHRKDIFKAGSVKKFLMSTPRDLGPLTHMRIWHDNSGQWEHASWFLGRVKVHDLQTEQM
ncbi:hypothetical protein Bbelb_246990, partial [Branchiostoma belcheri]